MAPRFARPAYKRLNPARDTQRNEAPAPGDTFDPGEVQAGAAKTMLDELLKRATALNPLRGSPGPGA